MSADRHEQKFLEARGVSPNHSVKFDVNKTRARAYAAVHNLPVTWVQAKDTPSQAVPALQSHESWLSNAAKMIQMRSMFIELRAKEIFDPYHIFTTGTLLTDHFRLWFNIP